MIKDDGTFVSYAELEAQLASLTKEVHICRGCLVECQQERHRLLVIATKWTDMNHHDWDELEEIETKGVKGE